MNEIVISPSLKTFCYFDEKNNMIDITSKIPFRLLKLVKKMKYIFGDDLVLDKSIIEDVEDIYHYIIEKAYERPTNDQHK